MTLRPWTGADWGAWLVALATGVAPALAIGQGFDRLWSVSALAWSALYLMPTASLLIGFGRPRQRFPGRPVPVIYRVLAWLLLCAQLVTVAGYVGIGGGVTWLLLFITWPVLVLSYIAVPTTVLVVSIRGAGRESAAHRPWASASGTPAQGPTLSA